MKISGSYTLPVEQPRLWELLLDPAVLGRAIPGCDRLERTGEDEYAMKMKLAIASISGLFDGKVRVADQTPPDSFRLIVEGSGKIGFMNGNGVLTLVPQESGAEVRYDGEVQVGGMIAGVGQRLIDTTAKLLIKRFFEKLKSEAAAQSGK